MMHKPEDMSQNSLMMRCWYWSNWTWVSQSGWTAAALFSVSYGVAPSHVICIYKRLSPCSVRKVQGRLPGRHQMLPLIKARLIDVLGKQQYTIIFFRIHGIDSIIEMPNSVTGLEHFPKRYTIQFWPSVIFIPWVMQQTFVETKLRIQFRWILCPESWKGNNNTLTWLNTSCPNFRNFFAIIKRNRKVL